MDLSNRVYLQTQINTTIPQTNVISTIKQCSFIVPTNVQKLHTERQTETEIERHRERQRQKRKKEGERRERIKAFT